jgi:hypothetical protein
MIEERSVFTQGGGATDQYELPLGWLTPLPLVAKHREKLHDPSD